MFPYFGAKNRKAPAFLHAQRLFFMGARTRLTNYSMDRNGLAEESVDLVGLQIVGLDTLVELYHPHKEMLTQAF